MARNTLREESVKNQINLELAAFCNNESPVVAILGSGPLATFTALLVASETNYNVIIADSKMPLSGISQNSTVFWPSPNDPPTRADVAHGHDIAKYLSQFCSSGNQVFESEILPLLNKHAQFSIGNWQRLSSFRMAFKDFEKKELEIACQLDLNLKSVNENNLFCDAKLAGIIDSQSVEKLILAAAQTMSALKINHIPQNAISLNEHSAHVEVTLDLQNTFKSDLVILATDSNIGKLLPQYKDICIPMADILSTWKLKTGELQIQFPLLVRSAFGHWTLQIDSAVEGFHTLTITGPRFLLPSAGAGFSAEDLQNDANNDSTKIMLNMKNYIRNSLMPEILSFYSLKNATEWCASEFNLAFVDAHFTNDCLPCDELPLLGEWGRQGRILGATGWLGCGFSAGAQAARILCDLVTKGRSAPWNARLSPARFNRL